jgi:hypothetical protein
LSGETKIRAADAAVFIAICVTALLGLFLLYAWSQERIRALAWWSVAYLIGGASGALWRFGAVSRIFRTFIQATASVCMTCG